MPTAPEGRPGKSPICNLMGIRWLREGRGGWRQVGRLSTKQQIELGQNLLEGAVLDAAEPFDDDRLAEGVNLISGISTISRCLSSIPYLVVSGVVPEGQAGLGRFQKGHALFFVL